MKSGPGTACAAPYPARKSAWPTRCVATVCDSSNGRTTWPPPKTSEPACAKTPNRRTAPVPLAATGAATSRAANATSADTATQRGRRTAIWEPASSVSPTSSTESTTRPSHSTPTTPHTAMTATCAAGPGTSSTTTAAAAAMVARRRSGVSERAMPSTACATTAAAAACSPSSHPAPARSGVPETSRANATSSTADGRVNPHHAARSPGSPARCSPSAIPTWLDAGPGRNWHSATRSA